MPPVEEGSHVTVASDPEIQSPITLDEYLHSAYQPDCDFADGEIQERLWGEPEHSLVQGALAYWFASHDKQWNTYTALSLRIRVAPTRVRIADVCLISRNAPREQVLATPPLAVIEVVSPEDRVSRFIERIDDYRRMGIHHIWVIDPKTRRGFDCSSGSWIETQSFAIEDSPIRVDLTAILAELT